MLDIEFNGRKFASDLPMEVIEIGAVRLNAELEPTDVFSSMVKPVYFAKLNSFIKKKTGIAQEEIDGARGFPAVIAAFTDWLRRSPAFLLLTWGGEDLKRIILDVRMHELDDAFWMSARYYDLLKGYLRAKGLTNDVSVEAAVQELGLPAEGSAHRALDDARMTAEVFRRMAGAGQLDLDNTRHYVDTYANAKERRAVKNALRLLQHRKTAPTWALVAAQLAQAKVDLSDARKAAELEAYYQAEAAKTKS